MKTTLPDEVIARLRKSIHDVGLSATLASQELRDLGPLFERSLEHLDHFAESILGIQFERLRSLDEYGKASLEKALVKSEFYKRMPEEIGAAVGRLEAAGVDGPYSLRIGKNEYRIERNSAGHYVPRRVEQPPSITYAPLNEPRPPTLNRKQRRRAAALVRKGLR